MQIRNVLTAESVDSLHVEDVEVLDPDLPSVIVLVVSRSEHTRNGNLLVSSLSKVDTDVTF